MTADFDKASFARVVTVLAPYLSDEPRSVAGLSRGEAALLGCSYRRDRLRHEASGALGSASPSREWRGG